MDFRLQHPFTLTVAGPSQCGKTYFVHKLITHREKLLSHEPTEIIWFCAYLPSIKLENVKYLQGLPDKFDMIKPNSLVVIDDLMAETRNSQAVSNLCTRIVHHLPCSVIMITQNLFQKGTHSKTININVNYLILFKNPRDKSQIEYIARQMYPGEKHLLVNAFNEATSSTPYSYLMLDLHPATHDALRIRTRFLPSEAPMKVFVSHKNAYKL